MRSDLFLTVSVKKQTIVVKNFKQPLNLWKNGTFTKYWPILYFSKCLHFNFKFIYYKWNAIP
jgi:hypothetical protein